MLLQADETAGGVGFGRGREAYGSGGVVEGLVEVAEIAERQAAHEIGSGIQRIGLHGFVQQGRGLFGVRAFAGRGPVFHGLRKVGLRLR